MVDDVVCFRFLAAIEASLSQRMMSLTIWHTATIHHDVLLVIERGTGLPSQHPEAYHCFWTEDQGGKAAETMLLGGGVFLWNFVTIDRSEVLDAVNAR